MKVMAAVLVPSADGVNLTLTWQLAFTARLFGQLVVSGEKSETFVPLRTILEITSGALPVLVSVTACVELVVANDWLPKLILAVDRLATGVPVPVPLRSTL